MSRHALRQALRCNKRVRPCSSIAFPFAIT